MNGKHLAICIPCESMDVEAVRCFGRLLLALTTRPPRDVVQVSQSMFASSMLPFARSRVVANAFREGATHVLCLDADMTYPPDVAHRLLAHGRPFVACNAVTRRPPHRWVAKDKAGEIIDSSKRSGLDRASVVGLAVALIERRVFDSISHPWFNFEWSMDGWRGEDVYFCDRAIASGFQPMIDNDLSHEIGHIGSRVYSGPDTKGG